MFMRTIKDSNKYQDIEFASHAKALDQRKLEQILNAQDVMEKE